ncbi:MAG: leucine-rich repeat domain-containing protein [Oscillospiraceae bacterium]|nr:leucine-rich repeat domain-containing protein [Oscillospiraceae bacterium]
MKKNLVSLLTALSLTASLLPAVPAVAAGESFPDRLPDEPAPIVIDKEVEPPEEQESIPDLLSTTAQALPSGNPELAVYDLGGMAMMAAEGRESAPANAVLIESEQGNVQMYCTLDRQNNTASLVYVPEATGMVVVPRTFTTSDGVEYTVTSVGYQAFAGRTDLTQVWLPDTVSAIGVEAFVDCDHLKAVGTYDEQGNSDPYALPKNIADIGVRTFRGCIRLSSITIPAKVERIDAWAFAYCYSLGQKYTDAAGVTYGVYFEQGSRLRYIAQGAFYYCMVLENITLPEGLQEISMDAFSHCGGAASNGALLGLKTLVLPNTVTAIGENAFAYCLALKDVTIPAGIKTLPAKAFYSCSAMETLRFTGDGLTTMDTSVFFWCTKLKTIRTGNRNGLPATLTVIPRWAFYRCDSLAEVDLSGCTALRTIEPYAFNESGVVTLTLPQNLKTIGMLAFESCRKLKTINWNRPANDEDLLEMGEKAFAKTGVTQVTVPQLMDGNSNGLEMFYDCDSLTRVGCEPNARFIPDGAFRDCDNLTTVTLGANIDTVGQQAFYSCPKLTNVNLASAPKLAYIEPLAFCRTALTTVSLPASIREIGLNAFGINRVLTSIEVAEGNPGRYYSVGGVLYQNNPDVNGGSVLLVRYPAGKAGTTFAVPDGVTAIESYAFSHSEKLTTVTFPTSLRVIGYYALSHCINLTTADVPEDVAQGDEIFEGSYHVAQVTLPPNIEKLTSSSFPVNSKVTTVTLPATVAELDTVPGAFTSLPLLREIKVDANNKNFKSVDGVLFSKDGKILYAYPRNKAGSEYVVPDGVTTIWYSAFSGAANLEHIVFPASVENVYASACHDLPKLSRLDIYREDIEISTTLTKPAYRNFLGACPKDAEVYLTGDPATANSKISSFYSTCRTSESVEMQNIHVGYFKAPTQTGDRFVENGVVYTLVSPTAKTVKVGDNSHYQGSSVIVPSQVTYQGVTYTVTAVESGAFPSSVQLLRRDDLTALTPGSTGLSYGDTLTVHAPANVKENATVTLTANNKSLTATVKGGAATFPVNRAMVDAFGFGTVSASATSGGATGTFTLSLSPKTLTIDDLPWYNTSLKYFLIEKPYDGTTVLDYTERTALSGFTVAGDDLAIHVVGTVPAAPSTILHGNGNSGTQISVELTGSAAKYYQLGTDVLSHTRVTVTKGQLYIKADENGVLQQPTYHRVWAAEDGVRLKDCNLSGGAFVAYLPTVENNKIVGYTQVDVKGTIKYTDSNPYPGLASFDEIGVQQNQVYHWAFVPEGNGALQEKLNNYTFTGTVMPWDTSLTKGKDANVGKAGENPALPAYVPQPQTVNEPCLVYTYYAADD